MIYKYQPRLTALIPGEGGPRASRVGLLRELPWADAGSGLGCFQPHVARIVFRHRHTHPAPSRAPGQNLRLPHRTKAGTNAGELGSVAARLSRSSASTTSPMSSARFRCSDSF